MGGGLGGHPCAFAKPGAHGGRAVDAQRAGGYYVPKSEGQEGALLLPRRDGSERLSGTEQDFVGMIVHRSHVTYRHAFAQPANEPE